MSVLGSLIEENVVYDYDFHCRECFGNVLGIRVRLRDILALDIKSFEAPIQRGIKHIGDSESRLGIQRHTPLVLKGGTHLRI